MALEDVGAVLITACSCRIHSHLLAEAADRRIPVIVCKQFRPVGIFLPIQRITDTLLTRAQIECPERVRKRLWQRIVDAKCENQLFVAEALAQGRHYALEPMRVQCAQRKPTKEGACAHLYWQICAECLRLEGFVRDQGAEDGVNSLLNYAYAVLLTHTLQELLLGGLDPQYGLGHAVRERAAPLAYDVMEILRPTVDAYVFRWVAEGRGGVPVPSVCKEYKAYLRKCFVGAEPGFPDMRAVLSSMVADLKTAYRDETEKEFEPWLWRTLKWDGSLFASISRS